VGQADSGGGEEAVRDVGTKSTGEIVKIQASMALNSDSYNTSLI
jgi:hypothetical protein